MESERVERKLAAILAADVAGYSRLMGLDEEGTLSALKAHRKALIDPKVTEHRGRIVKTTGDGMLVEFASAVDAVRCAVDVQRGMAERNAGVPRDKVIEFRVGINIGDIIVDGDDIYGDGVNVAARLETLAEPGGICTSRAVRDQVRDKLAFDFEEMGEREVKNIARPVHVYRIHPELGSAKLTVAVSEAPKPTLALPDKPSIAVLPFQNMSGDPEQEYFADGMMEDIITGLSRINWLFVIARNSSMVYKGRAVDVKQVGRELGVRYVLEGSVRKAGNRVRITGQLIEAETGAHLWADRFDGALEDVFDLQDRITETVVCVIEPNLRRAEIERARRKRPNSLGAYDFYLRALPHFASNMPEDIKVGVALLEEALRLDPDYASAHAFMAWGMEARFVRGGFNPSDAAAGVRHARAALAHGTDDAAALAVAGFVMLFLGHDFEAAAGGIARALALNASCASALYWGALIHGFSGDLATAEDYAIRALRVSPFDPFTYNAYIGLGCARFRQQRYDDAASSFSNAVQANPRFSSAYVMQTAALAMAGRIEEAKSVARRLMELQPNFRIRPTMEFLAFARAEIVTGFAAGLHQAGLPE